ncbi:MAG: glycosyltransferase [Lachnospiraceae bacterium]|nr:glycosyltransferase [Lachnospiraceae bacterium]
MKLLLFAEVYYPDVMGGGEQSTKQMAEGLAQRGHEVVVRCLGDRTCKEEINGVTIKRKYAKDLSEHFLSNAKNRQLEDPFSAIDKIARKPRDFYESSRWYEYYKTLLAKEKPDLVHTVAPMSYLGRINLWKAAHDLKIPVSHVCRGPNLLELKFIGGILDPYNMHRNAKASSYLTALAAPSRYMLERHNEAGIRGRKWNDVIYNAIDFTPTEPREEDIRKKENLLLYAGELREGKGIHTLLEAAKGIGDVRLCLIGKGGLAESLKRESGAEVKDWMQPQELYACMKRAKAVILPSLWNEPFGRVLTEAIYNGTLAIGSDRGGIPEVLAGNEDYIFRSGDAAGLAGRIERVLCMPSEKYLAEVKKMQASTAGTTREAYIDSWEQFFTKQLEI